MLKKILKKIYTFIHVTHLYFAADPVIVKNNNGLGYDFDIASNVIFSY